VAWIVACLSTFMCDPVQAGSIGGIFALGVPNKAIPEEILHNPNVSGVSILSTWSALQPTQNGFNWERIDRQVAEASAHHKKVSLGVQPGIFTPGWLYSLGVRKFTFLWDKPWGPPACSEVGFPIPWDPVYLEHWGNFIRMLGRRYHNVPELVMVKIEGINAQTPEFLLPHSQPGQLTQRLVNCRPNNDVAEWESLGYRPERIIRAWQSIARIYSEAFPNQHLILETGPWGMPPISESGIAIPGKGANPAVTHSTISVGEATLGDRFIVQNDGLRANWSWEQLRALAPNASIGFQMAWRVTDDPSCRMNDFRRPCDPRRELQEAINRGIGAGAKYFEIYIEDLANPSLMDIVENADRRLQQTIAAAGRLGG
jgi:hypothetical protein